jgi:hypothetical protein
MDDENNHSPLKNHKESKKKEYLYEKFKNRERNLTLDYARESPQKYFSSFKAIGREKRDYAYSVLLFVKS